MTRLLLFALVAALGLAACGSGADVESEPAASTESSETPEAAVPDVARVVCDANGAVVETSVVKPQPDGVHLEFVNETGIELAYSIEDESSGQGANLPAGGATEVLDLRPGTVSVSCGDASTGGTGESPGSPLEIVDQDGVWIPVELDCDETFSMITDYVAGATGESDPLAAAQKAFEPYVEDGDSVEPAGYPEAATRLYRLTRADKVLAVVDLLVDGAGGWLPDTVSGCASLQR